VVAGSEAQFLEGDLKRHRACPAEASPYNLQSNGLLLTSVVQGVQPAQSNPLRAICPHGLIS
jgi:hypothetical protein